MTSELVQNKYMAKNAKALTGGLHKRLELTRDESFIEGTQDIFDILARKQDKAARHEPGAAETISFLERARMMLQKAEIHVSEQDQRLKMLENISGIDSLTGFMNLVGFKGALRREIARTNRGYNDGGLLVLFSFENLGSILNDQGEDAAQTAIKLVAGALENEIREMDLAARTADDEFVLLFTDTSMSKALERLQGMALRLNRLSLICGDQETRISLSLGLKTYKRGSRAEQVFKDANEDLKRNSRGETHT